MWKTYEIETALFLMLFSISYGQSEESSNEVNCFFTDNAKILISELYYYTGSLRHLTFARIHMSYARIFFYECAEIYYHLRVSIAHFLNYFYR